MTQTTLTMAGHLAHAGAARPAAAHSALSAPCASALPAAALVATKGGYGTHQESIWTQGAIAKPATFMVFDRKNRPTRPLSELSP